MTPANEQPSQRQDDGPNNVPDGPNNVPLGPPDPPAPLSEPAASPAGPAGRRRPGQVLECGCCGGPIRLARVGRTPKWCSDACRHRAWQARQALAAATAGTVVDVRVVDRLVEVAVAVPVVERVEVSVLPKGAGWAPALVELARQLDTGRLYDRDLPALADALRQVEQALARRPGLGRQHR